jgi:two-component system sensor histidine kinase NreB
MADIALESKSTFPTRLLRRALPLAMWAVLVAGIGGGARLALSLGQPFPGFTLMWRKELQLYTVSYYTPSHWQGVATGMAINDRMLCIDGYRPHTDAGVYGLDPRYADMTCPQGEKSIFELFRERFDNANPTVEFLVDRDGTFVTVPDVPLVRFTPVMLVETFLPFFMLGLGLLAVGAVVYRANPRAEINLVLALFTTIIAGLMMDQSSAQRFSNRLEEMWWASLILTIPWTPLIGVVFFHLVNLLTDQRPLLSLARRVRRPYYVLSFLCSLSGLLGYVVKDEPVSSVLTWTFIGFIAASCTFAGVWGLVSLLWTWRKTSSRRIRRQTGLILLGVTVSMGFMIPFLAFFVLNAPAFRYIHSTPYLVLILVAVIAYAILRYQLFVSKARILTILLVTIGCILTANLVYLVMGQVLGFLPVLAAALLTSLVLEARQGPTAFFNRLLRRESLDYQTVARFSQRVGGLQQIEALLVAVQRSLREDLDVERIEVWLLDSERQVLDRFCKGEFVGPTAIPPDFVEYLLAQPTPVHATASGTTSYHALLNASPLGDESDRVALWVPLVDRGQAVGLLGLGPRWTGEVYDEQDLQLIGILARQVALSILNTRQWEHLQAMSRLILQAEENERRKIARELHDTILQFLLVLTYGLDDLRERQAEIATEIEHWQDRISAESGQLRDLLSYLRAPEVLVQQGLVASLQAWIERTRQDTAISIQADLAPEAEGVLSVQAQVTLYRVFREAIRNATKHSSGSCVAAQLRLDGDSVYFSIWDNGQGFDVEQAMQAGGRGYSSLQDMRIYVENVGGQLDICSAPGEGTVIQGQVPVTVRDVIVAKPVSQICARS